MDMTKFETDMKAQVDAVGTKLQKTLEEWRAADLPERKAIEAKLKSLEDAQASINEKLAQSARLHLPGVEATKSAEKEKFSYARMAQIICGVAKDDAKEFGYEREVLKTMGGRYDLLPVEMKTAINAATGAGGAFLIPTEVYQDIIPELEAASILSQLGLRSFSGLTGNVSWNRDLGGITAAYIDSEAEATGSESVPTFGHMELKPHVYAAFVPLTYGMLTQPAMALEPWVRSRMAYKIGLLKDLNGFTGTGSGSTPIGVKNAGIQTLDWTASPVTTSVSTLIELVAVLTATAAKLADANAVLPGARLGWAMGTFGVTHLSRALDTTGRPVMWNPLTSNLQDTTLRIQKLGGYQLKESTQLNVTTSAQTTESNYFGDWNQGAEFNWGTLAFASSDATETNFRKLRTTIRAVGAHDFGWFQPNAFVRGTGHDATVAWT